EDVGDLLLLKDAALCHPREPPELRNELHAVRREPVLLPGDLLLPLADPDADAVEVALAAVAEPQMDGDLLVQELVERDVGRDLGEKIELEPEELRDPLVCGESPDEEQILSERGIDGEGTASLRVVSHVDLLFSLSIGFARTIRG